MSLVCKYCNKEYKSYSSRSNHIRIYHSNEKLSNSSKPSSLLTFPSSGSFTSLSKDNSSKLTCSKCNKTFSRSDNLKRHQTNCINTDTSIKDLLTENEILKQHLKKQEELMIQLMESINKNAKIHPKTLQKINKQLINSNNNNTIINNTYVKFGNLSYDGILSDKEQREILRKQYLSLEESIKKIHFNKNLPEYNNVFITNMKDDIAYVFNGKQFISVRKNDMLNKLIDMHVDEINISFEKNKGKLNEKQIERLEKFLDMLNDEDTKYKDGTQRIFSNYKAYKINEVKLMIYNESDTKKLSNLTNIELFEKQEELDSIISDIEI
jgi:hypothetical protein